MRVLDSLKDLLTSKSSVQMVADDPHLSAEIMLLVRTMFADGELRGVELDLFKQLCTSIFAIPPEDVPGVIGYLKDISYETSGEQAAALFLEMPPERKEQLLRHMISMARADDVLHEKEVNLIARVSRLLGYTPGQVRDLVG